MKIKLKRVIKFNDVVLDKGIHFIDDKYKDDFFIKALIKEKMLEILPEEKLTKNTKPIDRENSIKVFEKPKEVKEEKSKEEKENKKEG